jgi:AGCS family alanine or glycine:cation symporter
MKGPDGALLDGAQLTIVAFESSLGQAGAWIVTIGLALFAFSTILGWEYIGEKALEFLVKKPTFSCLYRSLFALMSLVGATVAMKTVWNLSDIMNALMALPNLLSLLALSGVAADETKAYQRQVILPERMARKEKNRQKRLHRVKK